MKKDQRFKYSDHNFRKYVLPIIKLKFPGIWASTEKLKIDYQNCIDWIHIPENGKPVFFASRVWMSKPYPNHCVRWRKSTDPSLKLEVDIMLDNIKKNRLIPQYTIEAWIHEQYIYIAISDTLKLWHFIRDNIDTLPTIRVKNPNGYTEFLKVDFELLPFEPYKLTVPDFFNPT